MRIYKITNKVNGKMYVGRTVQKVEERFKQHCKAEKTSGILLHRAIQKHGKENFEVEIIEECRIKRRYIQAEYKWIKALNTLSPSGYNTVLHGGAVRHTKATREKMSKTRINREITWGKKIGQSNKGRKLTQTQKTHQSKVNTGRKALPAWKIQVIRKWYAVGGVSMQTIAGSFDITRQSVSLIIRGKIHPDPAWGVCHYID